MTENWLSSTPLSYVHVPLRTIPPGSLTFHGSFAPGQLGEWFRSQISCRAGGRPRAASFFKDFSAAGRAAHQTMRTKDKLESVDFNAAVAQFRAQISCRVRGRPRAASFFKDFFAAGCAAHQTMRTKDKLESVDFNAAVAQFRAQISCRVRGRPRAASFFKDFFAAGCAAHQTMRTKDKLESVDFNAAVAQFRAQISAARRVGPGRPHFSKIFSRQGVRRQLAPNQKKNVKSELADFKAAVARRKTESALCTPLRTARTLAKFCTPAQARPQHCARIRPNSPALCG